MAALLDGAREIVILHYIEGYACAEIAERLGIEHASAVSSGTAGLHLALRAVGDSLDDEVRVVTEAMPRTMCLLSANHPTLLMRGPASDRNRSRR